MKKISVILRKCKSLSGLGRSNSYTSLRSKSNRQQDLIWEEQVTQKEREEEEVVFVGSSRRPYVISSKHLNHPLISALIDRSRLNSEEEILVKCEVVLFDHLLWMLDNADLEADVDESTLKELAELYVY
ncbi:SAUR-like auxin-responsive protein family [Rhynchospora pubera]|uniref:SAUR-like auxin-responsive protein family n=1 Tax=Rhynchospora pubera TaxID=906938 RepID=A0AAV8EP20_9POAL|nr:SAUR-like auxin-responsive protein family [Rhynchospora pubera]